MQQPKAANVSTDLIFETWATELSHDPDMEFILDGVQHGFHLLPPDSIVVHAFTQNNKSALRPGTKDQIEAQLVKCLPQDHFGVSDKSHMPCAAFLTRSLSASSFPTYLNAVRMLHLENGLPDPTKNNFHLATTLRGIKRAKGLTVSQKKPITPQILLALRNQLNLDNPWHATFWAVCLVAFFGLLRKANLLCRGSTQFNPSKHLRREDFVFFADWAIVINRW